MRIGHAENVNTLRKAIKPSYQGKKEIVKSAPGLLGLSRFEAPIRIEYEPVKR